MDQTLQGPTGGAPVDWRGLCEELVSAWDCVSDSEDSSGYERLKDSVDSIRAALAQPEPEGAGPELDCEQIDVPPWYRGDDFHTYQAGYAAGWGDGTSAVRARFGGRPAPAPAGEVGEFADVLRDRAARLRATGFAVTAGEIERAADLLEQLSAQAAPAPVASDTRYEFSVYDEDYTEQAGGSAPTYAQALSEGQHYLAQYQQDGPHTLEVRRVEVLHPDALPVLPEDVQVIEPAKHTILVPVPVPVAVSERLPGAEDCDAQGRCWFFSFPFDYSRESWSLEDRTYGCNTGFFSHWLPFNALPLPGGEPQP